MPRGETGGAKPRPAADGDGRRAAAAPTGHAYWGV